jgi:hypothetical protein
MLICAALDNSSQIWLNKNHTGVSNGGRILYTLNFIYCEFENRQRLLILSCGKPIKLAPKSRRVSAIATFEVLASC